AKYVPYPLPYWNTSQRHRGVFEAATSNSACQHQTPNVKTSNQVYSDLHSEWSRSRSRRGQHPLARKSLFIICHFEVVFLSKVVEHNVVHTPSSSFPSPSIPPASVLGCPSLFSLGAGKRWSAAGDQ